MLSSDIFLSSKPRTVPDWQQRILLGTSMVFKARSVNVKNTHTHAAHTFCGKRGRLGRKKKNPQDEKILVQ